MNRPSSDQLEALVEFLESNPALAKGHLRSAQGKTESKRKWEETAIALNAFGGAQKDGKGWAKYWAEKKCALKKTCALNSASMRRTGGGPADSSLPLSAIEKRLVAVMGGQQFATGDPQLAVDPFPNLELHDVEEVNVPVAPVEEISDESHRERSPHTIAANIPRTRERSRGIPHTVRQNSRYVDRETDRLIRLEERRVGAEGETAKAISSVASALGDVAAAIRESAITVADALLEIAGKINK